MVFSLAVAEKKTARLVLILAFLFWLECDRGLPLGSLIVFFIAYYFLIYIPSEFLFRRNMHIVYVVLIYLGAYALFAALGCFGEALNKWQFFALFMYYAVLEGVLVRAFKI